MPRAAALFVCGMILQLAASAQAPKIPVLGTWKGSSLCTVRPSPCRDEVAFYTITESATTKGVIVWKADKIVDGQRVEMGVLECSYSAPEHTLTCNMPNKGVWELHVSGNRMTGTLKLPDGTLYRKVNVKREP